MSYSVSIGSPIYPYVLLSLHISQNFSKSPQNVSICLKMSLLSNFEQFWADWAVLSSFEQFWAILSNFEQGFWAVLSNFEQFWAGFLGSFEQFENPYYLVFFLHVLSANFAQHFEHTWTVFKLAVGSLKFCIDYSFCIEDSSLQLACFQVPSCCNLKLFGMSKFGMQKTIHEINNPWSMKYVMLWSRLKRWNMKYAQLAPHLLTHEVQPHLLNCTWDTPRKKVMTVPQTQVLAQVSLT